MNLIDDINADLEIRLKRNSAALDKMWKVRTEVEKLAKRTGFLEAFHWGFIYYSPVRGGRNRAIFRCYVENDFTYLSITKLDDKEEVINITYESLDEVLPRISRIVSMRLAKEGFYKV